MYPYIGSICRYMHVQHTLVKWHSEGTERKIQFLKHFSSHLANVPIIRKNFYEFHVQGTDKKCSIQRISYRDLIGVPFIESALYTNLEPIRPVAFRKAEVDDKQKLIRQEPAIESVVKSIQYSKDSPQNGLTQTKLVTTSNQLFLDIKTSYIHQQKVETFYPCRTCDFRGRGEGGILR